MRGFSGFTIIVATILSTIIHFFVLTLLDTLPLLPKDVTPRADLFMVDLMTLETARAVPQEEQKAVVQPVQKTETVEVKKPEEKKEVKKEEKKEVKKEEKREAKQKDNVVLDDRGKEKEKKEKTEKSTGDAEQQQLAAAIKGIEEKVAGRETQASAAEIQQYPGMVEERVKGFWVIPDTLSARELKTVVIFAIGKKGEVLNLRLKQSSGSLPYDQSVMRAINKAAPFSPPPQVLLEEEFELTFQP